MNTRMALVFFIAGISAWAIASEPEVREGYVQIEKVTGVEDFSWIKREIKKAPAFKSEKVRYTIWVLGDAKNSVMWMCWDESQGTGKGYDTLYLDTNFNGDLTETGKCFIGAAPGPTNTFEVKGIKDADGVRTFSFKFNIVDNKYDWTSGFSMTSAAGGYNLGLLPGNLQVRWTEDPKTAPVYRIGGAAIPMVGGKLPGTSLGRWSAGSLADVHMDCSLLGDDVKNKLLFYQSSVPGGYPQISLRVLGKDGAAVEDIAFSGGCGCAGSFGKSLLIPSRVPSGKHVVVIRMKRAVFVGGPADFHFPVEIENPDYGKPLQDPAYLALKQQFPEAKITSLRRAANADQAAKGFPEESVLGVKAIDNTLYGNTRDWNMSNFNAGAEPFESLGKQIHHVNDARSLTQFDLSTLPKDAMILGAKLRLTLNNQPFTGCKNARIQAYAVKQEWSETSENNGYSCWNGPRFIQNHPKSVAWGTPGCDSIEKDHFEDVAGVAEVGTFPANKDEHFRCIALEVTEIVKKWQNGQILNFGLLLKFSGEGCLKYCSSDFQDYPFRPTLVLAVAGKTFAIGATPSFVADSDEDFPLALEKAIKSGKQVLVKLYSPQCIVCRKTKETTFADEQVKKSLSEYEVVSMKIEENAKRAQDWGVGSVPTVVILKPDNVTPQRLIESSDLVDAKKFVQVLGTPVRK